MQKEKMRKEGGIVRKATNRKEDDSKRVVGSFDGSENLFTKKGDLEKC
jgi:hypothetical protein